MRPPPETVLAAAPELDPEVVQAVLAGLPDDYFTRFDPAAQLMHLRLLSALTPQAPALVRGESLADAVRITVAAYDLPGEFSWISGLMASLGGDVRSGDVFTLAAVSAPGVAPAASGAPGRRPGIRRRVPAAAAVSSPSQGRIIDVFELAPLDRPCGEWAALFQERLRALFATYAATHDGNAVREIVNNLVAESVRGMREARSAVLQPLDLKIGADPATGKTQLAVHGQDTPAFLYCLSNALATHGIYIHAIRIRTIGQTVVDTFIISDNAGHPLISRAAQERLRAAVSLTRQFSHFLGSAADPHKALLHFNALMERFEKDAVFDEFATLLGDAHVLRDLARILGAGDFLWEEFLRVKYERVLPLLGPGGGGAACVTPRELFAAQIQAAMNHGRTPEERRTLLNEYKDYHIFLIDLQYLLSRVPSADLLGLNLSNLAEAVVAAAADLALAELRERFGEPRNLAGKACTFCVLALGKLGGRELGYASDLELIFVYSDRGFTAGAARVPAEELFCRLAERVRDVVQARRQGIFEPDLRLRPHGKSGPLASSLETFCRYYSPQGEALDYERQALIKMRWIAGDRALGERLQAFRDEILYHTREVRYEAIDDLRRRQHRELAGGTLLNAKFSAGGLVDVEYAIQYLQILNGTTETALRTTNTRDALQALGEAGCLPVTETAGLLEAHAFLIRLVNALRMQRGNARDLQIPPEESLEFVHLARRMGYQPRLGFEVAAQMRADLGGHMAYVRDFCRRRFGRRLLLTRDTGNLADVALGGELPDDVVAAILRRSGFHNVARAAYNLRRLLGETEAERDVFCQLVVMAEPLLRGSADADMALNNWERFARAVISPQSFHQGLLREPQQIEVFLGMMGASQFLADVLVRNPESFFWVFEPTELLRTKSRDTMARELAGETTGLAQHEHMLNALRRARRRQLLRIGTRDLCLEAPFDETVAELSWLADGTIRSVLQIESRRLPGGEELLAGGQWVLLALGKLGGAELNYSSDVDLLVYLDDSMAEVRPENLETATQLLKRAIHALTVASGEGHMYRVDMRLRPFGSQGALVGRLSALEQYYAMHAAPWEIQALLKARAVIGDEQRARQMIERALLSGVGRFVRADFVADVRRARQQHARRAPAGHTEETDIKTGPGGIRNIEFAVQLLQLSHLSRHPELLEAGTRAALQRLVELELVAVGEGEAVQGAYRLLRRVEHLLQIMDDRQVHVLHRTPEMLQSLGRRLRWRDASPAAVWEEIANALAISAAFLSRAMESD